MVIIIAHKAFIKIYNKNFLNRFAMGSLQRQGSALVIKQLFNEQQSVALFHSVLNSAQDFNQLRFENVGIKIMGEALKIFEEKQIQHVQIVYDWNYIMMKPQLVCYDKNKWKTLQQLANWNKEWSQLFNQSISLKSLSANISISWMDEQFVKKILQGVSRLPNVQQVLIQAKSKDQAVSKMLDAFKQAKIFTAFEFKFDKL